MPLVRLCLDLEADNTIDIDQESQEASGLVFVKFPLFTVGFEFEADLALTYEAGEYWGGYMAFAPSVQLDEILFKSLEVESFVDLAGKLIKPKPITAEQWAEAKSIIEDFISKSCDKSLKAGNHHRRYSDPTL